MTNAGRMSQVAANEAHQKMTPVPFILIPLILIQRILKSDVILSAPGMIRTCDQWFRKPLLYPLSYEGEEFYSNSLRASGERPRFASDNAGRDG